MTQQLFDIAVVRPVKGAQGELMFTRGVYADSVTEAVKKVRVEVADTGWIVLQHAALATLGKSKEEQTVVEEGDGG